MRDLYQLLPRATPDSSHTRLAEALHSSREQLNDRDVRDIETVLLNGEVRPKYDRARRTLSTIGAARAQLDEVAEDNWTRQIGGDFFRQPFASRSSPGVSLQERLQALGRGVFGVFGVLALVLAITLLVTIPFVFDPSQDGHSPDESTSGSAESNEGTDLIDRYGRPPDEPSEERLSTEGICEVQERLATLGYYDGRIDGVPGPKTNAALAEYGRDHDAPDADLQTDTLADLREKAPTIDLDATGAKGIRTGTLIRRPKERRVAPLQVRVPEGNGDYYLKLVDTASGEAVMSFLIRAGSDWQTEVPLGTFELRYAIGSGWYGTRCKFGTETRLYAADRKMQFIRHYNRVEGHKVELIRQPGGNLGRRALDNSEF